MHWSEAFLITFSATAINHLGLVAAVEQAIRHPLPIVDCPKCLSFWTTLLYGTVTTIAATVPVGSPTGLVASLLHLLSISLLCAWLAIWMDLAMGIIDQLYKKIYDTFYSTANPTDTDATSPPDTLPVVSE